MKLRKLEMHTKQLLLTLSGVFVLLSNTAMAMEQEQEPMRVNSCRITLGGSSDMKAKKSIRVEMSMEDAVAEEFERSLSNTKGSDKRFSASFFGIGGEYSNNESSTQGEGYSLSTSKKFGLNAGTDAMTADGKMSDWRVDQIFDMRDRSMHSQALSTARSVNEVYIGTVAKDQKYMDNLMDKPIAKNCIKELSAVNEVIPKLAEKVNSGLQPRKGNEKLPCAPKKSQW